MKLTTKLLRQLIKETIEESQNTQLESEFKKPNYASDDYWKMHRVLTDKFGTTFQKIDGRMQRVETPATQKLIKDLEDLGREDVISAMNTLSEVSIFMVAEIAHYVETNDKEGLDKMVDKARRHGQAVVRSGPLGT
tara:strand:+ start:104 stop:511 length:408 start_codon:yes stop_codon:yes gene_type:complete